MSKIEKPPFEPGDWCVAEGTSWAYVPLFVDYPLVMKHGRWLYGNTDVQKEQWRKATKEDCQKWAGRVVGEIARAKESLDRIKEVEGWLVGRVLVEA